MVLLDGGPEDECGEGGGGNESCFGHGATGVAGDPSFLLGLVSCSSSGGF